jgi:hypothetical protein
VVVDLPQLPEISCDDYDADRESDDFSDLGGTEGKPTVSLTQTEFTLKRFPEWIGQANYSEVNKWKKIWVAGFLQKKHQSIIWSQSRLKQVSEQLLQ